MQIIRSSRELSVLVKSFKIDDLTIGFVPTMGALHNGHISLVEASTLKCNITIVSIFVNPTQFNNSKDLQKYPRTEDIDIKLLNDAKADIVFIPEVKEIYPLGELKKEYNFDGIDTVMEGEHRPGHFNGVGQVLEILFTIVQPDYAFFGQKDFQQVAIVKYLVKKYMPTSGIKIIACKIMREHDGLAMSSRNLRLTKEHRKVAPIINKTLTKYRNSLLSAKEIKQELSKEINKNQLLKIEYFEISDNETLKPAEKIIPGKTTGCIAVFAGDVRLIDNISY